MSSILQEVGLSLEDEAGLLAKLPPLNPTAGSGDSTSQRSLLTRCLALLPTVIGRQVDLALNQHRPFMPPDVTPEMMAQQNQTVDSMNHMQIIYCCVDLAMKARDYTLAAALVYVVDRASYRYGHSAAVLRVAEEIGKVSADTPLAPQVIIRQARVMKDGGELHSAMRVLDAVIGGERKWDYKSQEQYENTKAVCVQIKGQILHNLGLWKEAIAPLVESVRSFENVSDNKGSSYSLALLSRCLKKLGPQDYRQLQAQFSAMFAAHHPHYQAYLMGEQSARLIQDLGDTVYLAHSQLLAEECLLMFTVQQTELAPSQKLERYRSLVESMTRTLALHRSLQGLNSLEVHLAFLRTLFTITLALAFSPTPQDAHLARFLEQLGLELYGSMCRQSGATSSQGPSSALSQSRYSLRLMNSALSLLGLPPLPAGSQQPDQSGEDSTEECRNEELEETKEADETRGEYRNQEEGEQSNKGNKGIEENQKQEVNCSEAGKGEEDTSSKDHKPFPPGSHSVAGCPESTGRDPSVPPMSEAGGRGDADLQGNLLPPHKASTVPALSDSKLLRQPGRRGSSLSAARHKFVGLSLLPDEIRAATCPALPLDDADGKEIVDLDSLILSANALASPSIHHKPSLLGSDSSATVDQSAATASTSSETTEGSDGAGQPWRESSSSATVDQSATTQSTSSATTESAQDQSSDGSAYFASGSSSSSGHAQPRIRSGASSSEDHRSSDSDPSENSGKGLPPLVDVSASCELMSELKLGSSVETSDAGQFLSNFNPATNKDVHRAVLMTYNPVTGDWAAQTTLAFLGPQLDIATKGAHRDVFHISLLHQDEPLGRYVGKRYRHKRRAPEVYMQDVVCQMLAGFYVTRFNQALANCPLDILQAQFLSAAHLQLVNAEGAVFDWLNLEPFLQGSFIKLTNNLRFVSRTDHRGVTLATALSHFSFAQTGGRLMMVDLQGWTPADGKGLVFLTDPVFHTKDMRQFSSGDRHQEGMRAFFTNQHPQCNEICQFLGLDKVRPM